MFSTFLFVKETKKNLVISGGGRNNESENQIEKKIGKTIYDKFTFKPTKSRT